MDELTISVEEINVEETAHDVINVEETVHDVINVEETVPHNEKPITKMAISPKSKYIVTYSQEDKTFVGWNLSDNNISIYTSEYYFQSYMDFKVSDKKIIILNKSKLHLFKFFNFFFRSKLCKLNYYFFFQI